MAQPPPPPQSSWSGHQDQPPPGYHQDQPPPGYGPPAPPGYGPPAPPGYGPAPPPASGGNGKVIALVVAVAAAAVLVCGGAVATSAILLTRSGSAGIGATDDSGTEPVQWWLNDRSDQLTPVWTALADEFATAFTATVDKQQLPFEAYSGMLSDAMRSGQPPDLFQTSGGGQLREQVADGLVRDLTDDLADVIATLSPATLAPYTVDGRVYGLPYHTGMVGFWYNKALFAQAGLDPGSPPATWAEFHDAVAALKAGGISPIALGGADPWTVHFWFGYLAIRVAGVDALVEAAQRKSFSDNPDLLRAAELLAELAATEPFQPSYEDSNYLDATWSFSDGVAAMELMGHWGPTQYQPGAFDDGYDLGWFRFPAVEGGKGSGADPYGGGDGFAVGAQAPDAAVELLRFLFSDASYDRILAADTSLVTVRADAIELFDPHRAQQLEVVQTASNFQLYLDQDLPPAVGFQVHESAAAIVTGAASPEQALAQITDAFQREPD